jgi:hypothetical protein
VIFADVMLADWYYHPNENQRKAMKRECAIGAGMT